MSDRFASINATKVGHRKGVCVAKNKAHAQFSSAYFLQPNRLPRLLFSLASKSFRATSTLVRRMGFSSRPEQWEYPDSFWTPHNKSFFLKQDFQECYRTAILVAGSDYRIPWRVHQLLWAAESAKNLPGDIVEVGTGRGFMMAAVLRYLEMRCIDKKVFLYDLFQQPGRGESTKLQFSRFYADSYEEVRRNFAQFSNATLVPGDVYATLRAGHPNPISLLHLDLNDAPAETFVLEALWESLLPGALIVLDDYANRGLEDQYEAVNRFLEKKNTRAMSTASGQGIVIRPER